MDRASDEERMFQCLTCQHTEICNLDEEAEDERGMCKEYQMDVKVAMRLAGIRK
mgnify:CR=1 FL=1